MKVQDKFGLRRIKTNKGLMEDIVVSLVIGDTISEIYSRNSCNLTSDHKNCQSRTRQIGLVLFGIVGAFNSLFPMALEAS
jgi:hypothetical protein